MDSSPEPRRLLTPARNIQKAAPRGNPAQQSVIWDQAKPACWPPTPALQQRPAVIYTFRRWRSDSPTRLGRNLNPRPPGVSQTGLLSGGTGIRYGRPCRSSTQPG